MHLKLSQLVLFGVTLCIAFFVDAKNRPLTVATYAYSGIDRTAAITPLGNTIGNSLEMEIVIRQYDSPTGLIDALVNNEVDIAVPNLYGFLYAQSRNLDVAAIAVPQVPQSKAKQYRSVLVVKSGAKFKVERDLVRYANTTRVAMVWADSTSGGIIPISKLRELGFENPEKQFKSLSYSGSHEKALDMLLEGKVDVAGLALGVVEKRLLNQPELHDSIRIIWSSPPIPVGPILCAKREKLDCDKIAEILLSTKYDSGPMMQALNVGWPEFGGATSLISPNMADYEQLQLQRNP